MSIENLWYIQVWMSQNKTKEREFKFTLSSFASTFWCPFIIASTVTKGLVMNKHDNHLRQKILDRNA